MWFVGVTAPGADVSDTPRALARLKDIGAKGFFARVPRSVDGVESTLGTLTDFKKMLGSSVSDYAPDVLFYPQATLSGAHVTKLDQKSWWLPTSRTGQIIQFGDKVFGYTLSGDMRSPAETLAPPSGSDANRPVSGDGVALWCNKGTMKVTIRLKGQGFSVSRSNESAVLISPKKDAMTLELSETPVVIYGLPTDQLFPLDIAESEIAMLQDAVMAASRAGANVSGYAPSIERARELLQDFHPLLAYEAASSKLQSLASTVSPWVWIEGEVVKDHNFDGVGALEGCSGGQYLKLSAADDPPLRSYSATYTFIAPSDGSYDLWLAAMPPGKGASDLRFTLDGVNWQQVVPSQESAPYAGSFAWFKAGSANLTAGQHAISLMVTRTSPDAPYSAAIDALLFTKQAFTPNGTERPPFTEPTTKKPKR
jgi:hypothetical protein